MAYVLRVLMTYQTLPQLPVFLLSTLDVLLQVVRVTRTYVVAHERRCRGAILLLRWIVCEPRAVIRVRVRRCVVRVRIHETAIRIRVVVRATDTTATK